MVARAHAVASLLLHLLPAIAQQVADTPYLEIVPDRYTFEGAQPIYGWGVVPAKCCVAQLLVCNGTTLLFMKSGELLLATGTHGARVFTRVSMDAAIPEASGSRLLLSESKNQVVGLVSPSGLARLDCKLGSAAPTCVVSAMVASAFGPIAAAGTLGTSVFVATATGMFQCIHFLRCSRVQLYDTVESPLSALAVHAPSGVVAVGNARKLWLLDATGATIHWEWVTAIEGKEEGAGGVLDGPVISLAFDGRTGDLYAGTQVALNIRRASGEWLRIAGDQGLPSAPITAVQAGCRHVIAHTPQHWFGTARGIAVWSVDPVADPPWRYLHGMRWLPGERVIALAADGECATVVAATEGGLAFLAPQRWTLEQKAHLMESKLSRHDRHGLVAGCPLPAIGNTSQTLCVDDDNNGLWTAVVAAAALFRYAVTQEPAAAASARRFLGGLTLLHRITGIPGLYARSACAPNDVDCAPARATQRRGCDGEVRPGCCDSAGQRACGLQWRNSSDPGYAGWVWKSDVSSDETCGHFFAFSIAAQLAPTTAERSAAAETVAVMTDYMVENRFNLIDYTGYETTWGRWEPKYVNGWRAFSDGRGLNSLQILAFLNAALSASSALPATPMRAARRARWEAAYRELTNVTNGYDANMLNAKIECAIDDNYSDDQLQFMAYYTFLTTATDPARRAPALRSLKRSWEAMRRGRSDLWAAITMGLSGERTAADLASMVWNLQSWPLELINWNMSNAQRLDLFYSHDGDANVAASAHLRTTRVLPANERSQYIWNADPYELQNVQRWNNEPARRQAGMTEEDPGAFLLPYWLARFHGLLTPASAQATEATEATEGETTPSRSLPAPAPSASPSAPLAATRTIAGDGVWLNLSRAAVVVTLTSAAPEGTFDAPADLLVSEATRRGARGWSRAKECVKPPCIQMQLVSDTSGASCGALRLGAGMESSLLCETSSPPGVLLTARSKLGLSIASGRLLRELRVDRDAGALVPPQLAILIDPPPWAAWRGHQFTDWGFWMSDAAFEQFVRELIVFGTNRIELAHINLGPPPARDDSAALARMSRVADKYGLPVSLYNVPWPSERTEAAFGAMVRIDDLFGENGESYGGRQLLQGAAAALRRHHPAARVWHDPGAKNASEMAEWAAFLDLTTTRAWLDGVVYGPGILGGAIDFLSRLPPGYSVRFYPDICHTLTCMLPVPNWHFAWAFTAGRHFVNPLPRHQADIIRTLQNSSFTGYSVGFGAYSEGTTRRPLAHPLVSWRSSPPRPTTQLLRPVLMCITRPPLQSMPMLRADLTS